MARPNVDTVTIRITVSRTVEAYLEQLAAIGIHGSTISEVGKTFVLNEVERLVVKEGMLTKQLSLKAAKPSAAPRRTPRKK